MQGSKKVKNTKGAISLDTRRSVKPEYTQFSIQGIDVSENFFPVHPVSAGNTTSH